MNKYQQESRKGKRKKLYDLSKKNGIDDYNVYMPPPMRDHETKYSAGLNGISVYKNEKIYHMPSDFNILLNDENVIIDSSNSFEVAKLFIRLNTTDNVYFDESYFETEPPGFGLGEVFNVIVLTHGDNDMYNMKWGFMFLFNLGEIGHVYYQDLDDKGQYEKEGKWGAASLKLRNDGKQGRWGDTEVFWVNSLDNDCDQGSQINNKQLSLCTSSTMW